jgi:hypothetical protein
MVRAVCDVKNRLNSWSYRGSTKSAMVTTGHQVLLSEHGKMRGLQTQQPWRSLPCFQILYQRLFLSEPSHSHPSRSRLQNVLTVRLTWGTPSTYQVLAPTHTRSILHHILTRPYIAYSTKPTSHTHSPLNPTHRNQPYPRHHAYDLERCGHQQSESTITTLD